MFPRFLPQHSESVQLNYSDIQKNVCQPSHNITGVSRKGVIDL